MALSVSSWVSWGFQTGLGSNVNAMAIRKTSTPTRTGRVDRAGSNRRATNQACDNEPRSHRSNPPVSCRLWLKRTSAIRLLPYRARLLPESSFSAL
eukprot:1184177-Prorocentrum_minimum.AAC.2